MDPEGNVSILSPKSNALQKLEWNDPIGQVQAFLASNDLVVVKMIQQSRH